MLHALAAVAAVSALCLALANDDARYLLGQFVKLVACGIGVVLLVGFMAVVVISTRH